MLNITVNDSMSLQHPLHSLAKALCQSDILQMCMPPPVGYWFLQQAQWQLSRNRITVCTYSSRISCSWQVVNHGLDATKFLPSSC
jgi:hypothetical protein